MSLQPSQRAQRLPRNSLLKRLLCLLLFQNRVLSIQLRSHLHKGLWHPEQSNPNEKLDALREPKIVCPGHVVLPYEWYLLLQRQQQQTILTE